MKTKEEIKDQLWISFLYGLCDKLLKVNTTYIVKMEVTLKPENGKDLMQIAKWVNEIMEDYNDEYQTDGN